MEILLLLPYCCFFFYSIKQVNQYERGVKFRFGKYVGLMEPGWRLVLPVIESWARIDIRVKAVDVPDQEAITKDNVSAKVNAVNYYTGRRGKISIRKDCFGSRKACFNSRRPAS